MLKFYFSEKVQEVRKKSETNKELKDQYWNNNVLCMVYNFWGTKRLFCGWWVMNYFLLNSKARS